MPLFVTKNCQLSKNFAETAITIFLHGIKSFFHFQIATSQENCSGKNKNFKQKFE